MVGTEKNLVTRFSREDLQAEVHVEGAEELEASGARDRSEHDVHLSEHVVEGEEAEGPIMLSGALDEGDILGGDIDILVGQHHPLGCAGRPPRVEYRGHVGPQAVHALRPSGRAIDEPGQVRVSPRSYDRLQGRSKTLEALTLSVNAKRGPA